MSFLSESWKRPGTPDTFVIKFGYAEYAVSIVWKMKTEEMKYIRDKEESAQKVINYCKEPDIFSFQPHTLLS